MMVWHVWTYFFFFNDTATTEIYTLSLHDALPISWRSAGQLPPAGRLPGGAPGRAGWAADADDRAAAVGGPGGPAAGGPGWGAGPRGGGHRLVPAAGDAGAVPARGARAGGTPGGRAGRTGGARPDGDAPAAGRA